MFIQPVDSDDEEDAVSMPGGFPAGPGPSTPVNLRGFPGTSGFRVGFAGRGATGRWSHGHRGR